MRTLRQVQQFWRPMAVDLSHKLVVAISSRALFNLEESNRVYETEGVEGYARHQVERENEALPPGVAFPIVKKLLDLNQHGDFVEVILLSRNSADTGLRIFNSITHHQLPITRAAFTCRKSPYRYASAFGCHWFLSLNSVDVTEAINANCAAATLLPAQQNNQTLDQLHIVFDGDAVLFSNESEKIFQEQGIHAFTAHEKNNAKNILLPGPLKGFLEALNRLQQQFPSKECPIRTALMTARQSPAHERVIRTLREWNIRIDESLFLGGLPKGEFLKAFGANIFFDDGLSNCESALEHQITTGHVPNR